jgi:hypothetical protein
LCGSELFVVVAVAFAVARTEDGSHHVIVITSGSPIWGEVSMSGADTSPTLVD